MVVSEAEIERMARDLIAQWGRRAAHIAIEGLNKSVDLKDWTSRDLWVRVVRAIHESQDAGSATSATQTNPDRAPGKLSKATKPRRNPAPVKRHHVAAATVSEKRR
jgi:hypothetical protein